MAETKEEFFKRLDSEGIAQVRSDLATVYLIRPQQKLWANEWIHLFEAAADRSRDATSAEQLALARSAAANAEAAIAEAREANNIARSSRRIAAASTLIAAAIAIVAVIVQHYWH
jgi:hypothetical protein